MAAMECTKDVTVCKQTANSISVTRTRVYRKAKKPTRNAPRQPQEASAISQVPEPPQDGLIELTPVHPPLFWPVATPAWVSEVKQLVSDDTWAKDVCAALQRDRNA